MQTALSVTASSRGGEGRGGEVREGEWQVRGVGEISAPVSKLLQLAFLYTCPCCACTVLYCTPVLHSFAHNKSGVLAKKFLSMPCTVDPDSFGEVFKGSYITDKGVQPVVLKRVKTKVEVRRPSHSKSQEHRRIGMVFSCSSDPGLSIYLQRGTMHCEYSNVK